MIVFTMMRIVCLLDGIGLGREGLFCSEDSVVGVELDSKEEVLD